MKEMNEFLSGMEKYGGLFESPKNIERYYRMYAGRMFGLLSVYMREAFRTVGYAPINETVNPGAVARLIASTQGRRKIDFESLGETTPADFVVSFPDGFYGTDLSGSFVVTDLLSLEQGELVIRFKDDLLQQILLNHVVPVPGAVEGMHRWYLRSRSSTELADMVGSFLVQEFLKCAELSTTDAMRSTYSDSAALDLSDRLKYSLTVFDEVFVRREMVCDHSFNYINNLQRYTAFFDRFESADPPVLQELVSHFRLDK